MHNQAGSVAALVCRAPLQKEAPQGRYDGI